MLTRYRRQNVEGARLLVASAGTPAASCGCPATRTSSLTRATRRQGGACCSAWRTPAPTPPSTTAATATAAAAITTACSPGACLAPAATRPRAPRQHPLRHSAACRAHPLLCLGKGEWAPAAALLMMTNDDTRGHKRRKQ